MDREPGTRIPALNCELGAGMFGLSFKKMTREATKKMKAQKKQQKRDQRKQSAKDHPEPGAAESILATADIGRHDA